MSPAFTLLPPAPQRAIAEEPYDSWINPAGDPIATFYRQPGGYLVRLIDQGDFAIDAATLATRCTPVPDIDREGIDNAWHNAVAPLLANHSGGLAMHGSAVVIEGRALAFMGASRRGKSTLAAAFARHGHAFLTEDVLDLERDDSGYRVVPHRPLVRVFADSAEWLAGGTGGDAGQEDKRALGAGAELPHAQESAPLAAIFVLGPGDADAVTITPLDQSAVLQALMPQSFLLDVEDRERLHRHFGRIADLAMATPCHLLDYPRRYDHLPDVIDALVRFAGEGGSR